MSESETSSKLNSTLDNSISKRKLASNAKQKKVDKMKIENNPELNELVLEESLLVEPEGVFDTIGYITFNVGKISFILLLIVTLAIGFVAGVTYSNIANLKEDLQREIEYQKDSQVKNESLDALSAIIDNLNLDIDELYSNINTLNYTIDDKNMKISDLNLEIGGRDDIISLFSQREELFNKYDHALYFGGKRTDITYDQLVFGINEMEKRGLDPNLMFGLFKLETGFKEDMTSDLSSARGYGAFLGSSGKWVYEDLLKKEDEYNHDMALNGYINMEMTAELLSWNMERYDGDIKKTLIAYNGNEIGPLYYDIINRYVSEHAGYSIYDMEAAYRDKRDV